MNNCTETDLRSKVLYEFEYYNLEKRDPRGKAIELVVQGLLAKIK